MVRKAFLYMTLACASCVPLLSSSCVPLLPSEDPAELSARRLAEGRSSDAGDGEASVLDLLAADADADGSPAAIDAAAEDDSSTSDAAAGEAATSAADSPDAADATSGEDAADSPDAADAASGDVSPDAGDAADDAVVPGPDAKPATCPPVCVSVTQCRACGMSLCVQRRCM